MSPPSAFRPNNPLCGPRTNSICETSRSAMLEEFAFNCGTPSKYVVTPGLAGLAPSPRMRALLNLRAVNSVNVEFGANTPASLMAVMPAFSIVSEVTVVTLTGSVLGSAGSFCAVTVIAGRLTFGGVDCPLWDNTNTRNAVAALNSGMQRLLLQ